MELICFNDVCKYNANCRDCLYRGMIVLDDDGGCDCFKHYKSAPEYQTIYFKACFEDGRTYKRIAKGRKTVCNGFTLYYEEKDLTPETWCTEGISGIGSAYKSFEAAESAERIREITSHLTYKNVNDLPYKSDDVLGSINSGVCDED